MSSHLAKALGFAVTVVAIYLPATIVNGGMITNEKGLELTVGDTVQAGNFRLKVQGLGEKMIFLPKGTKSHDKATMIAGLFPEGTVNVAGNKLTFKGRWVKVINDHTGQRDKIAGLNMVRSHFAFVSNAGSDLTGVDGDGNEASYYASIEVGANIATTSFTFSELGHTSYETLMSDIFLDLRSKLDPLYQSRLSLNPGSSYDLIEFDSAGLDSVVTMTAQVTDLGAFKELYGTAVPEPSTWALAVSAIVALSVVGWRSRLRQRLSFLGLESSDCLEGRSSLEFNDDSPAHCGW